MQETGFAFQHQLNLQKVPKGLHVVIFKVKSLSMGSVTEFSYSLVNDRPQAKNSSKCKNIHQLLVRMCQNHSLPLPQALNQQPNPLPVLKVRQQVKVKSEGKFFLGKV